MNESKNISASNSKHAFLVRHARRFMVAAFIFALAGLGIYEASEERELSLRLLDVGVYVGMAVIYGFGFFWCFPEFLGTTVYMDRRTLWLRWSDFARLAAAFAITIVAIAILWGAIENLGPALAVGSLILAILFIAASVVASEEYMGRTMERGTEPPSSGWKAVARKQTGHLGSIVRWLTSRRALLVGGALLLASVLLPMDLSLFSVPPKGYEILFGADAKWGTTYSYHQTLAFLDRHLHNWIYRFDIVLAVGCLIAVLIGRRGDGLRRNRLLARVAGVAALYEVSNKSLFLVGLSESLPEPLLFAISTVVWIAPVVYWRWRVRGVPRESNQARLTVMVLLLPVFFVFPGFLSAIGVLGALGYVAAVMGILLLWWGLVQSEWEWTEQCSPSRPKVKQEREEQCTA
jgi:hypothetical protein